MLKSLPASLGQLGSLKQLTLTWLGGLKVLPDAVVRLTSLGSLTIECCDKMMIPFIVLTETKFSFRCIPVWDRYSPYRTRV